VLPTGDVMHVGDGIGHKISKSSSGYQLKHLFMGHQGTLGIVTEATLELVKRPEAEFSAFYAYRSYEDAWRATGDFARSGAATLAGVVLFDEWKVKYLRRDDRRTIRSRLGSGRRRCGAFSCGTTTRWRPRRSGC
jgi:glycolate oxidase